nr:MAG TPA: hypothetical protein [Caudoviricetes sp.]
MAIVFFTILMGASIIASLFLFYEGIQLCKDLWTAFLELFYIAISVLFVWFAIIDLIKLFV